MSKLSYLKEFDSKQLWRFFIDGRFHKKYNGWVGYETGERGSIQALLNGFSYMIDNFDLLDNGLKSTYLRELHKLCMMSVETTNLKSSPGDIRYLNAGMPFFAKSTTYEHLVEVFELRKGDGTNIFNTVKYEKTADELDVAEVYKALLKDKRINYRNWYPNLNAYEAQCLNGDYTLKEFYEVKHKVQMLMIEKVEDIVQRFNKNIKIAKDGEEKLKVLTLVSRELELLHPFPDGNSRTFSCIMNMHLFMYHGFVPPIYENPNYDNELSHAQWIDEVKKGMERTKELLKNPQAKIFNYSIDDMNKKDIDTFLSMAKVLTKKIDNYQESYLTPKLLEDITSGKWKNINYEMRFSGVGDYNTFRNKNIYFMLSLNEWKKDKLDIFKKIDTLYNKGIKAFVTDNEEIFNTLKYPTFLVNDNIKQSYIKVATKTRELLNPQTVLITGTEGKTGFKTQLHHVLNFQTSAHANINSANTEIPVLRSLINLRDNDKVEINEVSVGGDEALRIERTSWVQPDICVFTNISPNHMDMHKSIDNILQAKSSVIEGLRDNGIAIINSDMQYYEALKKSILKRKKDTKFLTFGKNTNDDAQLIEEIFNHEKLGWEVKANILDEEIKYFIPMIQSHIPLSTVSTLLCVKVLGYNMQLAAKDFEKLKPYETMGRMLKIKKPSADILFYDQSRRGGVGGMESAFEDLNRLKIKGKVVALVGGISIKKDSDWTKESHTFLAKLINNSKIDRLYTTGNFMNYVEDNLKNKNIFIKHSDDLDFLANSLLDEIQSDDLLFIIGSAYLYLGRVTDIMFKKYTYEYFDYKKPLLNKSKILLDFFNKSSEFITKTFNLKDVSNQLPKHFNKDFTDAWFYNYTNEKSTKGKSVFGSYFYFNSPEYLLHVDCATHNIHIGLIKYELIDNKIKQIKATENDLERVKLLYKNNLKLELRNWGGSWISIDCGKFIDLEDIKKQNLLLDIEHSPLYKNIIIPFIKSL